MITCDYREAPLEPTEAIRQLSETFMPLFNEFWEQRGRAYYEVERWEFQAVDFTQLWLDRRLTLIMAEEDGQPAGFIMAAQFRPLTYNQPQFLIDQWYGRTPEVEAELFNYLEEHLKFFQVEAVIVPEYANIGKGYPMGIPGRLKNWRPAPRTVRVYRRK